MTEVFTPLGVIQDQVNQTLTAEETSPQDTLNANLEQNVQNLLAESRSLNLSTLQSSPQISPYGLAQSQLNYEAQSQQQANRATDSIEARGNYAYDAAQSAMDLQTQLANQQLAIQKAQQQSQFWGSVLGATASLAGLALFSSEENKEGVVDADEPRVNENSSNIPQRFLDTWANYLSDNKEDLYNNGVTVEKISQSPLAKSLTVNNPESGDSVDYAKLIGALTAGVGDAFDKIQFLQESTGKKSLGKNLSNIQNQTQEVNQQNLNLAEKSNKVIANLVNNELQYQKAVQQEGQAYADNLERIQKKYPTQSIADIQNSLTATQRVMQAFAFIAGGISQGLTGSRQNPGAEAYNAAVNNLLKTNELNYEKQMRAAEYVHGETLSGLRTQFEINRDLANMSNGQIKDIKNVLEQNLKNSQNALQFQLMSQEAYEKTQLIRTQQESFKTDLALKKMQLLATLSQQDANPLSVKITNTDTAVAKSAKSADMLNTQLPTLNARINELAKLYSDAQKKQNLDEVAARFRQIGFGTPDNPKPFLGNDKSWEKQFGKTQGWFSDTQALETLKNAIYNSLQQTKTYRDELIVRNTVSPQRSPRQQTVDPVLQDFANTALPTNEQSQQSASASRIFNLQPQDIRNIQGL